MALRERLRRPANDREWDRFWRWVKFEALHEPDRVDYFEQLDAIERRSRLEEWQQRAADAPSSLPGSLTPEQALTKLVSVRRAGRDSWMAKCPLHEDDTPSLLVRAQPEYLGHVYVHCFAGCDWKAIRDWLKS